MRVAREDESKKKKKRKEKRRKKRNKEAFLSSIVSTPTHSEGPPRLSGTDGQHAATHARPPGTRGEMRRRQRPRGPCAQKRLGPVRKPGLDLTAAKAKRNAARYSAYHGLKRVPWRVWPLKSMVYRSISAGAPGVCRKRHSNERSGLCPVAVLRSK